MAKLPWMKFFTGTWLTDPCLSRCSAATRGIWMDLIASMHEDRQSGEIYGTVKELCQVARCSPDEFIKAMTEISEKKVGDVKPCPPYVPSESLKFHVKNRRMSREFTEKDKERKKKQNQRDRSKNKACPGNVPPDVPRFSAGEVRS